MTVGLEGTATYHLLDDADAANTRNYSDAQAAAVAQGAFFLRSNGNGVGGAGFGTGFVGATSCVVSTTGRPDRTAVETSSATIRRKLPASSSRRRGARTTRAALR